FMTPACARTAGHFRQIPARPDICGWTRRYPQGHTDPQDIDRGDLAVALCPHIPCSASVTRPEWMPTLCGDSEGTARRDSAIIDRRTRHLRHHGPMGAEVEQQKFSGADRVRFRSQVSRGTEAIARMLSDGLFTDHGNPPEPLLGMEVELN